MPNRDCTGPVGAGPITGNFPGRGRGRVLAGRGLGNARGGSRECTCPNCGHKEMHVRGTPCSERLCPKCQTPMRGVYCS